MEERFLVTGATGCIGAWTVRNLVREGVFTCILVRGVDLHRPRLIMDEDEICRVTFVAGDITDIDVIGRALAEHSITHVIHLAAMQLPFCRANPPLGAAVNVQGTVNVFEAAKQAGIKHVVYASSTAVYGPRDHYPDGPLVHDAPLSPRSHYGVYKQANEGTAGVYWREDGISSVGIRPYVVYGPGRDQGMTSTPTKAMLAAAAGLPYHITYGGRFGFQYVDDTARAFIGAARAETKGAGAFNLGGQTVGIQDVIREIVNAQPSARDTITYDEVPLPFPEEIDNAPLVALLGGLRVTPLADGVRQTIALFKEALADGRIRADAID
ncbi:MAG: NAD(P)-dependent oxidoreductase [Deltaproteobacteria bacterium]|nr:NAD(P)-dependent oxidoreductase [Candidatus Zymogenaceae bacterium]